MKELIVYIVAGLATLMTLSFIGIFIVVDTSSWKEKVLSCEEENGVPVTINGQVVCFERSVVKWSTKY